jgi:lipoic acid synthetase
MAPRKRFPPWLKRKIPRGGHADRVRKLLADLKLATVCQNALCPNLGECFGAQTATFLIMGCVCTRNCRFCAITGGTPEPLDPDEPRRIAEAARRLELKHVVVTSVTRDDLPDGGASHFIDTVCHIRAACNATVEILTPDFQGDEDAILAVAACEPDIFNHNVETVPRLYESVRPLTAYRRSLDLLHLVKDHSPAILTKSGLMVGLGETGEEVESLLRDLRAAGTDIVTIGQYLQPRAPREKGERRKEKGARSSTLYSLLSTGKQHLPVERYVHPDEFEKYRDLAQTMGFLGVASGPYVRSSYKARKIFDAIRKGGN